MTTIVRWVAFAGCIALFAAALAHQDLGAGISRIRSVGPIALLALLPLPVGLLSDALAWQTLLAALGKRVPLGLLFRTRLAVEAVTNSTPGGPVWGEALAPVLVARKAHVPVSSVVASQTAKRWLVIRAHGAYVAAAAIFGFPALATASERLGLGRGLVAIVLGGALALIALAAGIEALTSRGAIGARLSRSLGSARFTRIRAWIEARRHHFSAADARIAELSANTGAMRKATLGVLGLWLVEGVETFTILHLLGADIGLASVMSFDAALSVVRSAAIFAPGGIGVQDVGYLAVLDAYGVPSSSGIGPAFVVVKRLKEAFWIAVGFVLLAIANRGASAQRTPPAATTA